jgi:hypothetical protein
MKKGHSAAEPKPKKMCLSVLKCLKCLNLNLAISAKNLMR